MDDLGHGRALICYFSFSNQTHRIVQTLEEVLNGLGVTCVKERLRPVAPLEFPVNSISGTLWLMLKTLFRWRVAIHPLSDHALEREFDAVVLAGPTWSYNPSGPILSLMDQYGGLIFRRRIVIPVISCRSYWKAHFNCLKARITGFGGTLTPPVVLKHPLAEPWKTLGVFLTIAGKNPRRLPVLRARYTQYGHTRQQLEAVREDVRRLWSEYVGKTA